MTDGTCVSNESITLRKTGCFVNIDRLAYLTNGIKDSAASVLRVLIVDLHWCALKGSCFLHVEGKPATDLS